MVSPGPRLNADWLTDSHHLAHCLVARNKGDARNNLHTIQSADHLVWLWGICKQIDFTLINYLNHLE
jgi:hypothetical protein